MKELEGQLSLFDQDTPSGRTSPELSAPTTEKTSRQSSKKPSGSSVQKRPLLLSLIRDGLTQECSWELMDEDTLGLLLGESTMLNFGESPSDGDESLWSRTITGLPPVKSCLSNILEEEVDGKYYLSEVACRGILTRAKRRGKELPEELRLALLHQAKMTEEDYENLEV